MYDVSQGPRGEEKGKYTLGSPPHTSLGMHEGFLFKREERSQDCEAVVEEATQPVFPRRTRGWGRPGRATAHSRAEAAAAGPSTCSTLPQIRSEPVSMQSRSLPKGHFLEEAS